MTRRKPNQLENLKKRVAGLETGLDNIGTLSIAYLPGGQVISAALQLGQDRANLLSIKRALQNTINHLDSLLVLPAPVPTPTPEPPP